jgi:hypothetical protein
VTLAQKRAKREIDHRLIGEASELTAALIRRRRGEPAAETIICVPCGHSRRPDCFGKRLAQGVAELLGLPFPRSLRTASALASATRRNTQSSHRLSKSPIRSPQCFSLTISRPPAGTSRKRRPPSVNSGPRHQRLCDRRNNSMRIGVIGSRRPKTPRINRRRPLD